MIRGKFFKDKVFFRVFIEDFGRVKNKIFDFCGQIIRKWNKFFFIVCLVFLFVDFLFFFLLVMRKEVCIIIGIRFEVVFIVIRFLVDVFYIVQIVIWFRMVYIVFFFCVFGRGEFVIDLRKIVWRYFNKSFWIYLVVVLFLFQV